MVLLLSKVVVVIFIIFVYREYKNIMSKKSNQDELHVIIGGKSVPVSSINKPHARVVPPNFEKPIIEGFPKIDHDVEIEEEKKKVSAALSHKPVTTGLPDIEPEFATQEALKKQKAAILEPGQHKQVHDNFPDIEPEAKVTEDARAKAAEFHSTLDPNHHKPVVNADTFPDVEPDAKASEAEDSILAAVLEPGKHKPVVDAENFPEVEPEAKIRDAERIAKKDQ